jgi:hypothetical protein
MLKTELRKARTGAVQAAGAYRKGHVFLPLFIYIKKVGSVTLVRTNYNRII